MTWILITIFASLMQSTRSALQKHLKNQLSATAITATRFFFGLPFIILFIWGLHFLGFTLPQINDQFLLLAVISSIAQIIGTILLVQLFSYKNFAVGTTYVKTETIQTAIIGWVLFGEKLSEFGIWAIILGLFGIFMISAGEEKLKLQSILQAITKKAAILGILSGMFFSFSALCIKSASNSLNADTVIAAASFTLLVIILIQTVILLLYLLIKQPEQLDKIAKNYKLSTLVGLTSFLGSLSWFSAFSLANVAYVKTIGQIEILFSILITHKIFKERFSSLEIFGIILVVSSIVILILS